MWDKGERASAGEAVPGPARSLTSLPGLRGIWGTRASGETGSGPITGGLCWSFAGPRPRPESGGAQGVSISHNLTLGPRWRSRRSGRGWCSESRSGPQLVSPLRTGPRAPWSWARPWNKEGVCAPGRPAGPGGRGQSRGRSPLAAGIRVGSPPSNLSKLRAFSASEETGVSWRAKRSSRPTPTGPRGVEGQSQKWGNDRGLETRAPGQ